MQRVILLTIAALSAFLLSGCAGALLGWGTTSIVERENKEKCWQYEPEEYETPRLKFDNSAAVLPFDDARKPKSPISGIQCVIPLALYCTFEYEPPEGNSEINPFTNLYHTNPYTVVLNPTQDFANGLAEELKAAGIFRSISFGTDELKSDYIIRGRILETTLGNRVYTYGFLFFGFFFWGAGLPAGSYSNDVSIELTCTDTRSGETVFSKVYTDRYRRPFWFYRQPNYCMYGQITQSMYKQFIGGLTAGLQGPRAPRKPSSPLPSP